MGTVGIIISAMAGAAAGNAASAAGAPWWVATLIVMGVASASVIVWDALTDWKAYERSEDERLRKAYAPCTRRNHECWNPEAGPCNGYPKVF